MQRRARVQELEAGLAPGRRPFQGKSFYLDLLQSKHAQRVVEAIGRMGGTIESFLSKEVSYLVSRSQEARQGGIAKATTGRSVQEASQGGIDKAKEGQSVQEARQGGIAKATTGRSVQEGGQGGIAKATKGRSVQEASQGGIDKAKEGQSVQEARQGGITSSPSPPLTSRKGNQRPASTQARGEGSRVLADARSWGVKVLHIDAQLTATTPVLTRERRRRTHSPPKRVLSADRFFSHCGLTIQPPQSYSVGGQRSSRAAYRQARRRPARLQGSLVHGELRTPWLT
ncbi:UNVERIFIED_CONTAM: hypothetical protein FKN15_051474 [Acipenser sinensis]